MKPIHILLASLLTAAIVHGSAAQAAPCAAAPQPIERQPGAVPLSPKAPADPIKKDFKPAPLPPGKPPQKLPKTTVLPATPAFEAVQPAEDASRPSADAVLREMGKSLGFAGGQIPLGGYYDGGQGRGDAAGPGDSPGRIISP